MICAQASVLLDVLADVQKGHGSLRGISNMERSSGQSADLPVALPLPLVVSVLLVDAQAKFGRRCLASFTNDSQTDLDHFVGPESGPLETTQRSDKRTGSQLTEWTSRESPARDSGATHTWLGLTQPHASCYQLQSYSAPLWGNWSYLEQLPICYPCRSSHRLIE